MATATVLNLDLAKTLLRLLKVLEERPSYKEKLIRRMQWDYPHARIALETLAEHAELLDFSKARARIDKLQAQLGQANIELGATDAGRASLHDQLLEARKRVFELEEALRMYRKREETFGQSIDRLQETGERIKC